jgi:predicted permease
MDAMLNVVLPVFGIIFTGYLSRRLNVLGEASAEALNRFVYYIAVPPLLFLATARAPIDVILNWSFIAVYLIGVVATLILAVAGGRWFFGHRDLGALTVHGFASVFSNTVYMGIPLFLAAFGEDGTPPIIVAALVSNLLFLGTAIICMELAQTSDNHWRKLFRDLGGAVALNPILLPLMLGLLASYRQWWLPPPLENFLDLLAGAAGPTALFAMGLSLYGFPLVRGAAEIGWLVFLKLLVNPLFTWLLVLYVFELDPFWASAAVLIAAIPSGSLVFVIAQRYRVYVQRAAATVVVSTLLSLVTLSLLLAWLGTG